MANETRYFKTPFANSGARTALPDESVSGYVGLDTGYGADYELAQGDASRKRIERTTFNQIFYAITENLKQWQENNYPTWIEDTGSGTPFSYSAGVVVTHDSDIWISLEASNTDEPSGISSKWKVYNPVANPLGVSGTGGELTQTLAEVQGFIDDNINVSRTAFTLLASDIAVDGASTLSADWDSFEEIIFDYAGSVAGTKRTHITMYTTLIDASDSTTVYNYSLGVGADVGAVLNFRSSNKNQLYFDDMGNNDKLVSVYGRYPIA